MPARALFIVGLIHRKSRSNPVVFLILPVTAVFAVFPGLSALRLDLSRRTP